MGQEAMIGFLRVYALISAVLHWSAAGTARSDTVQLSARFTQDLQPHDILASRYLGRCMLRQTRYQRSSREIRRLASVARSPVYSGFSEALDGAASIRAFQVQAPFAGRNIAALAALQRANLASAGPS